MPTWSLNLFQVEKLLSEFVYFITVSLRSLLFWTYLSYIDDKIVCELDFLWHRLLKTPGALFVFHGWFYSFHSLLFFFVVLWEMRFFLFFIIKRISKRIFIARVVTDYLWGDVALRWYSIMRATFSWFVWDVVCLGFLILLPLHALHLFNVFFFDLCRLISPLVSDVLVTLISLGFLKSSVYLYFVCVAL